MIRVVLRGIAGVIVTVSIATTAAACKYSVRDVSFVDLGEPPYRLLFFAQGAGAQQLRKTISQATEAELADANVAVDFVDVGDKPDQEVMDLAKRAGVETYPAVVLYSLDDRLLKLSWKPDELASPESLRKNLASLATSPLTERIFAKILTVHSVILLIESADADMNKQARELADEAVLAIEESLPDLPKPIDEPPHVITVSREEAQGEKILLFSLGVDLGETDIVQFALLIGRGRKLGTVLTLGENLEEPPVDEPPWDADETLLPILGLVGQDCECGLDRSWMQGVMIPHRWTPENEAEAVKSLGFDPGNPLVKSEVSRILARGPGARFAGLGGATPPLEFPALDYDEIVIEEEGSAGETKGNGPKGDEPKDDEPKTKTPEATQALKQIAKAAPPAKTVSSADGPDASAPDALAPEASAGGIAGMVIVSVLVIAVLGSCLVLLRARREA